MNLACIREVSICMCWNFSATSLRTNIPNIPKQGFCTILESPRYQIIKIESSPDFFRVQLVIKISRSKLSENRINLGLFLLHHLKQLQQSHRASSAQERMCCGHHFCLAPSRPGYKFRCMRKCLHTHHLAFCTLRWFIFVSEPSKLSHAQTFIVNFCIVASSCLEKLQCINLHRSKYHYLQSQLDFSISFPLSCLQSLFEFFRRNEINYRV